MLKNTKDIIFLNIFLPIILMGAVRYSCPIRLVPTSTLPAKERRLLRKFQSNSFKTKRQVCVETDGQTASLRRNGRTDGHVIGSETSPSLRCKRTEMPRSTRLVMLA